MRSNPHVYVYAQSKDIALAMFDTIKLYITDVVELHPQKYRTPLI
jgi:hypothetical protein